MSDQPPVSVYLTEKNIPHRVFRHAGHITSLEQAAEERGQKPEQVIRSIVFRISEGTFVMALVAGGDQISWSTLRSFLGQSRVTMASEDEVLASTGYRIGSVSPFGLKTPIRILIDQNVIEQTEISIGSGERGVAIIMQKDDLLNLLKSAELARLINREK